jgi:hypothetical protein
MPPPHLINKDGEIEGVKGASQGHPPSSGRILNLEFLTEPMRQIRNKKIANNSKPAKLAGTN